jgi:hypothetical protein
VRGPGRLWAPRGSPGRARARRRHPRGRSRDGAAPFTRPARTKLNPPSPHLPPAPRYTPDYTKCLDHFALHAGGYAVLKGIQKGMNLPMEMMLPSFASLRDYGNTSSSTTWYSIAYLERFGMVKKGQRIMQVRARPCRGAWGRLSAPRGLGCLLRVRPAPPSLPPSSR